MYWISDDRPFINNKIFSTLFYIFRFISLHTKLEFDFLQLQIFFWQKIFYVIQTYKKSPLQLKIHKRKLQSASSKKYKVIRNPKWIPCKCIQHLLKQIYHENWVTSLFITQSCQMKCPQETLKFSCVLP